MNIIFVSNSMTKAKTLTLPQVLLALILLIAVPVIITLIFTLPQGDSQHRGTKGLLPAKLPFALFKPQAHIDALALQLGEIQARLTRLDAQSDRLSNMAGVKQQETKALEKERNPGRGGPEISARQMTEVQLRQKISELTAEIDRRSDYLSAIEAQLLAHNTKKEIFPNHSPVALAYNSSSYGWRVDPFTGHQAFHEGLDFTAEAGTPIYASAGGIVTMAEQTHDYGKIVKIEHGAGLETRYAHASEILVKAGDRVEKGQLIAKVGSTGRSTGAHLHFEVRLNGAALDPRKYLSKQPG